MTSSRPSTSPRSRRALGLIPTLALCLSASCHFDERFPTLVDEATRRFRIRRRSRAGSCRTGCASRCCAIRARGCTRSICATTSARATIRRCERGPRSSSARRSCRGPARPACWRSARPPGAAPDVELTTQLAIDQDRTEITTTALDLRRRARGRRAPARDELRGLHAGHRRGGREHAVQQLPGISRVRSSRRCGATVIRTRTSSARRSSRRSSRASSARSSPGSTARGAATLVVTGPVDTVGARRDRCAVSRSSCRVQREAGARSRAHADDAAPAHGRCGDSAGRPPRSRSRCPPSGDLDDIVRGSRDPPDPGVGAAGEARCPRRARRWPARARARDRARGRSRVRARGGAREAARPVRDRELCVVDDDVRTSQADDQLHEAAGARRSVHARGAIADLVASGRRIELLRRARAFAKANSQRSWIREHLSQGRRGSRSGAGGAGGRGSIEDLGGTGDGDRSARSEGAGCRDGDDGSAGGSVCGSIAGSGSSYAYEYGTRATPASAAGRDLRARERAPRRARAGCAGDDGRRSAACFRSASRRIRRPGSRSARPRTAGDRRRRAPTATRGSGSSGTARRRSRAATSTSRTTTTHFRAFGFAKLADWHVFSIAWHVIARQLRARAARAVQAALRAERRDADRHRRLRPRDAEAGDRALVQAVEEADGAAAERAGPRRAEAAARVRAR